MKEVNKTAQARPFILLSAFSFADSNEKMPANNKTRLEIKYSNKSEDFRVSNFEFDKQFNHIYKYRLKDSAEFLKKAITKKWGKQYKIQILNDLKEENHERCVIIGTIFKKQELKPSVLKEISEQS